MVINGIVEGMRKKTEEHNVSVPDLIIGNIVDFTGPRRLTTGVFKSSEVTLNHATDIKSISNLTEPRLISDVLILLGYSFAASMNHYEENQGGKSLVIHHYAGSWKNEHLGELA